MTRGNWRTKQVAIYALFFSDLDRCYVIYMVIGMGADSIDIEFHIWGAVRGSVTNSGSMRCPRQLVDDTVYKRLGVPKEH